MSYSSQAISTPSRLTRALATAYRLGLHRYTLLAALLIAFTALVTLVAPTDPDVWWHLRDGQLILNSGVPTTDVYSFTAYGRPWFVQEWLTEVVMYMVKSAFGYGVLSLVFGVLQALGGLVVYRLCRYMGAGRLLALLLLMLYAVFATPTWGVRPQVITPVLLGTFYIILLAYKDQHSRVRLLWILPPMMLLWVNMHASYFMGIALIGAFMVGEIANNYIYRPEQPIAIQPLAVTLGACLLATLVNPYFLELWTYPLTYVLNGTSNPLLTYTQEWQSPNFHEPGSLLFGISIVALAIVGLTRSSRDADRAHWRLGLARHIDITHTILLVAFTVLALQAVRLVPVYGVIVLPLLARGLVDTIPVLSKTRDTSAHPVEGRVNWGLGVAGVVAISVFMLGLPQAQTGSEPRTQTSISFPETAADYISGLPGDARMYNDFAWGGYLIYRLYPAHHVFIDGRADMYRVGVFEDSIKLQGAGPGWRDVLAKYEIDTALTLSGGPLDAALSRESGWVVGHRDPLAVVYRKAR